MKASIFSIVGILFSIGLPVFSQTLGADVERALSEVIAAEQTFLVMKNHTMHDSSRRMSAIMSLARRYGLSVPDMEQGKDLDGIAPLTYVDERIQQAARLADLYDEVLPRVAEHRDITVVFESLRNELYLREIPNLESFRGHIVENNWDDWKDMRRHMHRGKLFSRESHKKFSWPFGGMMKFRWFSDKDESEESHSRYERKGFFERLRGVLEVEEDTNT